MPRVDGGGAGPVALLGEHTDVREACGWNVEIAEMVAPIVGRLGRLARRIIPSEGLADDAVQEALVSLWKEGRIPPNPAAWLSRAVVNRSLHLNRSRNRRRRHELRVARHKQERDPRGDASTNLQAQETGATFAEALARLPERLRIVFVLFEFEQLDYDSIARRSQIPLGTVRSRLWRARAALKQALESGDRR